MATVDESRLCERRARRRHNDVEYDVSAPAVQHLVEGSAGRGAVEVEFRGASARAIELEVDKAHDGQSVDAAGRVEPGLAHGAAADKHGIDHLAPPCGPSNRRPERPPLRK